MRKLYHPFGNHPEHMQALGEMTAAFADLENRLSLIICALIGSDPKIGQIVTTQLSYRRIIELVGALFGYKVNDKALVEEFGQLLKKALTVEGKRNTFTHSQFIPGTGKGSVHRFKATAARDGLRTQFERISVDEIIAITDQIDELTIALTQFQTKVPIIAGTTLTV